MANKERFNIKHFVKASGVFLPDADVLSVSRLKLVIERAGATNEITVYGRIAGQSSWDLIGTVVGNTEKEFDVSLFDHIKLESTVYDSPTNYLEVTGSGFYLNPAYIKNAAGTELKINPDGSINAIKHNSIVRVEFDQRVISYDPYQNPTQILYKLAGVTVATRTITYDANLNVIDDKVV